MVVRRPQVTPAAGGTCVEMAANQGNWRPLLGLLRTHAPGQGLRSHAALLKIADDLLNSQCLPCVDGSRGRGYPPCSRCMNDPLAHTAGADFHQCMRVLVAMGLNVRAMALCPPLPIQSPHPCFAHPLSRQWVRTRGWCSAATS